MSTLKVNWRASESLRKREFCASGHVPNEVRSTEFDMASLSAEEREIVFEVRTFSSSTGYEIDLRDSYDACVPQHRMDDATYYYTREPLMHYEPPTLTQMLRVAQANWQIRQYGATAAQIVRREQAEVRAAQEAAAAAAEQERIATMTPTYNAFAPRAEAAIAGDSLEAIAALYAEWPTGLAYNFAPAGQSSLDSRLSKRRKELETLAEANSKTIWIADHGSDYLKRATAAGHDCGRLYWIERAADEYPGYVLDYEREHESKVRSCPSLAALDERDAVLAAHPTATIKIEWITAAPQARKIEECDYFEECEGIVVDDPAYERYLVKLL
jgi:hypothetical protein